MAKVLKPLVGKLPHNIQSTNDFVSKVREVTLLPGECLSSYNVTVMFTSVPIDPALNIKKDLLEQDETLCNRTVLSVQNIIELLGFYLLNTYFSFQNKFYEQVEGASYGVTSQPYSSKPVYGAFQEIRHSCLPLTPQGFVTGLWMTLWSSNNRPT